MARSLAQPVQVELPAVSLARARRWHSRQGRERDGQLHRPAPVDVARVVQRPVHVDRVSRVPSPEGLRKISTTFDVYSFSSSLKNVPETSVSSQRNATYRLSSSQSRRASVAALAGLPSRLRTKGPAFAARSQSASASTPSIWIGALARCTTYSPPVRRQADRSSRSGTTRTAPG